MDTLIAFEPHYDAVIVGARCAGAATALLLARSGAKVLLVDRQAYGSDTMSTHALMRGGVLQLNRWGLIPGIAAANTPAIRATTFHYGSDAIRVAIKPEHGVDCLYAPRRTVLDRHLVDAARKAGADVQHGVIVTELLFAPNGRVTGVTLRDANGSRTAIRAGIVIGADGRQSTVAGLVKARTDVECAYSAGLVYGYFENLEQDGSHWYYGANCAAGVIPTNGGHCVFAAVPAQRFSATFRGDITGGFLQILDATEPGRRDRVERGSPIGRLRGFGGARGFLRQCHGPGWALVGDAGYFKDPLTAHGITDALRDAELLAIGIADGSTRALERYQRERDALSLPFLHITDAVASFSWSFDEVQQLHMQLSGLMNAQAAHLAGFARSPSLAA
jgi:flavin-dependent dehydrogenase